MKKTALISLVSNRKGFALNVVLPLVGLLALVSMILPELYVSSKQRTVNSRQLIELRNVARNLKELGKYLILYERVVFLDNPLDRSDTSRLKAQQDLWPQTFGSVSYNSVNHMLNACGGYDALANFIGTLSLGQSPVFCPMYVRNSMMSGKMLEDMVFEKWSIGGPSQSVQFSNGQMSTTPSVMNQILKGTEGRYYVEFDMTKALRNGGNQMLDPVMDNSLRDLLGPNRLNATAKLKIELYTDSFGFSTDGNNRFIKVTSTIEYGPQFARKQVYDQESFTMFTPTVKDFAIFIPYPTTATGIAATRTSQSMILGGRNTKVYGRVYFNGDMDTALDNLPTFYETVVLSGKLIPGNAPVSPKDYAKIREKFRKGIVTGFAAPKYVMDGKCGDIGGEKKDVANQTGLYCIKDGLAFGMKEYIYNLGLCTDFPLTVNAGVKPKLSYTPNPRGLPNPAEICPSPDSDVNSSNKFVRGGWQSVTVTGPVAFIASPVTSFRATTQTNIYGVVMGGHVDVADGSTLRSIPYFAEGQPGIGTTSQLEKVNTEAGSILEGVAAPLMGFPLVQATKQGIN